MPNYPFPFLFFLIVYDKDEHILYGERNRSHTIYIALKHREAIPPLQLLHHNEPCLEERAEADKNKD